MPRITKTMRARVFPDDPDQRPFLSKKTNALLASWDRKRGRGQPSPARHFNHNSNNKDRHSTVWTVKWPKKMFYTILSIFLAIPLLIFFWKETHNVQSKNHGQRQGDHPKQLQKLSDKDRLTATWMEDEDVAVPASTEPPLQKVTATLGTGILLTAETNTTSTNGERNQAKNYTKVQQPEKIVQTGDKVIPVTQTDVDFSSKHALVESSTIKKESTERKSSSLNHVLEALPKKMVSETTTATITLSDSSSLDSGEE